MLHDTFSTINIVIIIDFFLTTKWNIIVLKEAEKIYLISYYTIYRKIIIYLNPCKGLLNYLYKKLNYYFETFSLA